MKSSQKLWLKWDIGLFILAIVCVLAWGVLSFILHRNGMKSMLIAGVGALSGYVALALGIALILNWQK